MYNKWVSTKSRINIDSSQEDRKISLAIVIQFCMLITNYAIKEVLQISNSNTRSLFSLMFMILVGIFYLKNLKIVFKRNSTFFVTSYILCASVFLLSAFINPETIVFLPNIAFWFFIICLPTAQYYLAIKDKTIFLNMLITSGYYQLLLGLVIFVSMILATPTYDMVFSYLILVPTIILSYKIFFIKFKFFDIFLIILSLTAIITVGSRGPLLSYLLYMLLLIIKYLSQNKLKIKTWIIFLLLILVLSIVVINFNLLIEELNKILINNGIQSRTTYLLLSDDVDFSTGRSDIFSITIKNISAKPILGHGIGGDRLFLNGTYPHNIFLEIVSQFGIILGFIFCIILIFYWIKSMFFNKNKVEQDLVIIFAGIGLFSLFFSGTYLTSSNFWLFMSICISSIHFRRL